MKPQRNSNGKKANLFSKWVGEGSRKAYTHKELGHALLACLGLIALSIVLTSGTRFYNYEHFVDSQGGFLPDGFGYQLTMFLLYEAFNLTAVICSYISSKRSHKKLMFGATTAAMGISAITVLILLFGLDFLTIISYVSRSQLGFAGFSQMITAYFDKYGVLYLLPTLLAAVSFGAKAMYHKNKDETSGEHGTATFASKSDLEDMGVYKKSDDAGAVFGKDDNNKLLRYPTCNRTIIAKSGSGKTSGVVIPTLLTQKRPMFVYDIKGELWAVTARQRCEAFSHEIVTIDPYGITRAPDFVAGKPPYLLNKVYRYNPLDSIPRDDAKRDAAIGALVKSLTSHSSHSGKENHFEEMAETLLMGLIEWVIMKFEKPNLMMVHDLLNQSKESFESVLTEMSESSFLRAKAAGSQTLGAAREERGSIFTTTYRQIKWLADPNLRDLVSESNFDLKDLITGKADIFITMPNLSREQSCVFRMLLASVRNLMVQTPKNQISKEAILFLFDELGQLGYCPDIEDMMTIMRAYNANFWAVFQDIGQIKKYGNMKSLFMGEQFLQCFGITDSETIEWLCRHGGQKTYINSSTSESMGESGSKHGGKSKNESVSAHESGAPLLKYNQIREMGKQDQLVFIEGEPVIKCKKIKYFDESHFAGLYDHNPVEDK